MDQQIINAVVLGSIYVLFALGLSLTWGTLNVLNLAHGSTFMFSAFTAYLLIKRFDIGLPWLILVAAVVGGILSLALDVLVFNNIRKRVQDEGQAELAMLIASIGAATIPVAIAQKETNDSPFSLGTTVFQTRGYSIAGVQVTNANILIVAVTLVASIGLALWVARSRNGQALRALAYDRETCGLMGINQGRLSALTLLISGASAGVAGILLIVYLGSMTPESGESLLLKAFAAVILGGVGSVWGTLIGGYILAFVEISVTATTSGAYTDAVSFAIIVIILVLRPQGLFSKAKVDRV